MQSNTGRAAASRTNVSHRALPLATAFGLLILCIAALALALHSASAQASAPAAITNDNQPQGAISDSRKPAPVATGSAQVQAQKQQAPAVPQPSDAASQSNPAPQPQNVTPDRTGGPDGYGYTFIDDRDPGGPNYTWQPGSQHIADSAWQVVRTDETTDPWDDGVVTYTLPFIFNYYGINYNVVHVSTNGIINFGAPNDYWPQRSNECLPSNSQYVPQAMIAPLWYDFVVSSTLQSGVYTDILGSAPNRTYLVEWRNVTEYGNTNIRATFEVLLHEDGSIVFQYNSFNGGGVTGSEAVVGIQNESGSVGLPYGCYTDVLAPERAILYQLQRAVFLQPGDTTLGGAPGVPVTYTETLRNQTGIANSFDLSASGQNWTATVNPSNTGNIPSGGSTQVTVRVDIPPGVSLGASDVATLSASSTLPTPGAYTDTAVLTTTASTLGADFAPPTSTKAGDYGAPVTYTLSLTNRSGQTNNFHLTAANNLWTTTISPSATGNLASDASTPITVSVHVPSNVSLGASDVVSVTAEAQLPSPGQFYGVTVLTTTAGIWRRESNMPLARSRGATVAFPPNGRVYVIGGEYNNGDTNMPIEEYDTLANTWTTRATLQTGVGNVGAAVIGSAIYIPGGYSTSAPAGTRSTLQVYYPLEDRVATITTDPLPAPRFGAGVAAYNGKLYVIGGSDDSLAAKATVFEYDPSRPAGSRWQTKASMLTARVYLGAAEMNGLIYAAGGVPGTFTDLSTVEAYNPATNTWTSRHPMSLARGGLALVGVDSTQPGCGGYLYAVGGGWVNYTASAERYNPATNSWEPISSLTAPRRTLSAAYSPVTYSLIATGGWDGNYDARTEAIRCSGGLTPPTATPTVPVSGTPTHQPTASATPLPDCSIRFTDVQPDNTFYANVVCLACMNIVSGYPCGEDGEPCIGPDNDPYFRPNNNVTRGQLAKIVANSANITDPATSQTFQDVPPDSTFYLYVQRLADNGVMSGYPCGGVGEPCVAPGNKPYFRPNANATRGQISKIISNAAGFSDTPTAQMFQDVPVNSTYYLFTARLASRGVMSGYSCGSRPNEPCVAPGNLPYFRTNNNATRGQTSKIDGNTFYPGCNPGP